MPPTGDDSIMEVVLTSFQGMNKHWKEEEYFKVMFSPDKIYYFTYKSKKEDSSSHELATILFISLKKKMYSVVNVLTFLDYSNML